MQIYNSETIPRSPHGAFKWQMHDDKDCISARVLSQLWMHFCRQVTFKIPTTLQSYSLYFQELFMLVCLTAKSKLTGQDCKLSFVFFWVCFVFAWHVPMIYHLHLLWAYKSKNTDSKLWIKFHRIEEVSKQGKSIWATEIENEGQWILKVFYEKKIKILR